MGMKLEAIREDRTRGGRSTYQCSYTFSLSESRLDGRDATVVTATLKTDNVSNVATVLPQVNESLTPSPLLPSHLIKCELSPVDGGGELPTSLPSPPKPIVPRLIQEILSVEHLWHSADKVESAASSNGVSVISRREKRHSVDMDTSSNDAPQQPSPSSQPPSSPQQSSQTNPPPSSQSPHQAKRNSFHLMETSSTTMSQLNANASAAAVDQHGSGADFFGNLCNIADHRLYKIVKWCKSLPLFREIQVMTFCYR